MTLRTERPDVGDQPVTLDTTGETSPYPYFEYMRRTDPVFHGSLMDHELMPPELKPEDEWVLFGSANWDTRSLRLNFELDVECYDRNLCAQLMAHVSARLSRGRELSLRELSSRPLSLRVRDGFARLLMPYL